MSLESYRNRVLSKGQNVKESTANQSKRNQIDYILNSPTRSDVIINKDINLLPCIVNDIDTFKIRKFLFTPDMNVYMGDYIHHDGFTYLAIDQTTDKTFPQITAQLCNFEILIKQEEIKTIVGKYPNGQPIYDIEVINITAPCVFTENIYSSVSNSSIPLPSGNISIFIPYTANEPLPNRNQTIINKESEYKILDFSYDKIVHFNGVERGCLEIKLQRVQQGGG